MEQALNILPKRQIGEELRQRLQEKIDLPVLPEVAHELLQLRNKSDANASALVDIISKDPVISAQILRYARMSVFGYGERIKTLDNAINLVLGYEKAIYMAMGLSAGRGIKVEKHGPLGLKIFWKNALNCALLTQALAKELPVKYKINQGVCYLAGLFHDIGFPVLGSLYPDEFAELNKEAASYEWDRIRDLEFHSNGISHDMIGSYLMRAWDMPDEIVIAVGEHHFPDYDGQHAIYSKLVYLAEVLVQRDDFVRPLDNDLAKFEETDLDEAAVLRALELVGMLLPDINSTVDDLLQA